MEGGGGVLQVHLFITLPLPLSAMLVLENYLEYTW